MSEWKPKFGEEVLVSNDCNSVSFFKIWHTAYYIGTLKNNTAKYITIENKKDLERYKRKHATLKANFSFAMKKYEQKYKPYAKWEDWMVDVELKDKVSKKIWTIVGRQMYSAHTVLRDETDKALVNVTFDFLFTGFETMDGKPFGEKE